MMRRAAHRDDADGFVLQRLDRGHVEHVLQYARVARPIYRRADQHGRRPVNARDRLARRLTIGTEGAAVADLDGVLGKIEDIDGDIRMPRPGGLGR